ncbi:MAG: DUF6691 family protein [Polyangiaceae bacterium]
MKRLVASFASGALFATGLVISGMTRPAKVTGFLDVFGAWDASLAFVMVGAIVVHAVALRFVLRRGEPLFGGTFHLPTRRDLDPRLLVGAGLFGVGWALAGYCPGPGLVAAGSGSWPAALFTLGMILGVRLERRLVAFSPAPS